MTTPQPTPLQHLMRDLQQRQKGLGEQLQAFEALQQEIAQLQQRAPHDAQARQRLNRLARAMQNEFAPLNQRLMQCAESLQGKVQALEASLRGAGNMAPDQPAVTRKRGAKLFGRAFI